MSLVAGLLSIVVFLVAAWVALIVVVWLHRPSRALAGPVLRLVPDLVRLVRSLLAAQTTPRGVKLALAGLLAYLLSPIDLIPDFIPVLGSMDDVVVTALVLRWAGRRVGVEQIRSHWSGSEAGLDLLMRLLGVSD